MGYPTPPPSSLSPHQSRGNSKKIPGQLWGKTVRTQRTNNNAPPLQLRDDPTQQCGEEADSPTTPPQQHMPSSFISIMQLKWENWELSDKSTKGEGGGGGELQNE